MSITDAGAIKFSNEHMRPCADRLARCRYRAKELVDAWSAAPGDNNSKLLILEPKVRRMADLLTTSFRAAWWEGRLWQANGMSSLFPNDAAQVVFDNSDGTGPDTTRGQITGQDVRRLKQRLEEFVNWMSRGTDLDKHFVTDATAVLPALYTYFDDAGKVATDSVKTITGAQAAKLVDRCNDLVTEYATTNPGKFAHILTVAVNPQEIA